MSARCRREHVHHLQQLLHTVPIDKRAVAPLLVEDGGDAQTMVVDVDVSREFLAAILLQWVAVAFKAGKGMKDAVAKKKK